ncbi:MAG: 50S ribosomal protein L10 [Calditrichia bacterium]
MPNAEKVQFVEQLSERLKEANSVFVVDFTGMSSNETVELRKEFKQNDVEFKVVRNTLAKISFEKAGYTDIQPYLDGVNGYVISYDDPTLPVKLTKNKKELKDKFRYKLAIFEGKLVPPEQIESIANLPSREELLATLLSTLKAPMSNLVGVLSANMQNVLGVLEALKEKKEK